MPKKRTIKLTEPQNNHLEDIHALFKERIGNIRAQAKRIQAGADERIARLDEEIVQLRVDYQAKSRSFLTSLGHELGEHDHCEGQPEKSSVLVTGPTRAELRRMEKERAKAEAPAKPKRPRSRKATKKKATKKATKKARRKR